VPDNLSDPHIQHLQNELCGFALNQRRFLSGSPMLNRSRMRDMADTRQDFEELCIGYNHVPIAFYATQKEYDVITTSPTDLQAR